MSNEQLIIKKFMDKMNINYYNIQVTKFNGLKGKSPAYSRGGKIFNTYLGEIGISNMLEGYAPEEFEFILAHELSHILLNHWPKHLILELPDIIWNALGDGWKTLKKIINIIRIFRYARGIRPIKESVLRCHEFEADHWAVQLQGTNEYAISCLNKLALQYAGGNLNNPSHFSEIEGIIIYIASYAERIQNIKNILISNLEY